MKPGRHFEEKVFSDFRLAENDFLKWISILQRFGLKPRRFIRDEEGVCFGTQDGWYRISFTKYPKEELNWVRNILEYLEERSFQNWAVPWQKTLIWEENTFCYLIQPWLVPQEFFSPGDPAAVRRVAEVMADFYRCGKDFRETKGLEINRDRWNITESNMEAELRALEQYDEHLASEKIRKDMSELKKVAFPMVEESVTQWKNSGLNSLRDHHCNAGVLSHGGVQTKDLVWNGTDYCLLNWERLAFQPRIVDIASLITYIGWWEPEWIVFFINEYAKNSPFWPEEYNALRALLRFPQGISKWVSESGTDDFDRKHLKEVLRELSKKEQCLTKVWKELGSQSRWAWGKSARHDQVQELGKISLTLSPMESWGECVGSIDSTIKISDEQKLPQYIYERLTSPMQDRIVGGRDGNILDATSNLNQSREDEIVEEQPIIPEETIEESTSFDDEISEDITIESSEEKGLEDSLCETAVEPVGVVIKWANFPKIK